MAIIDNKKIEALELLINMFLTTGQYVQAKKSVRALRVLLRKREQANNAKTNAPVEHKDENLDAEQDVKEIEQQALEVVRSGALSNKADRHKKERQVDIVKLEAVVNYFAQEYELCINLIDRYEQEHNASELLKIDFNQAQEQNLPELESIIELRTMILLKAKCLFLLGEQEQSRSLLKEKLMWQAAPKGK